VTESQEGSEFKRSIHIDSFVFPYSICSFLLLLYTNVRTLHHRKVGYHQQSAYAA